MQQIKNTRIEDQSTFINTPVVVLVEPQLSENIGMAARAMANFGLSVLRIVNPRHGWPDEKARSSSRHAFNVIDNAVVFSDLSSAIADLQFILASTARPRDSFKPVFCPVEGGRILRMRASSHQKTGILFGRERTGLLNEEIIFADGIVTFPTSPSFSSLNVAQAVLLVAYEWMKSDSKSYPSLDPCVLTHESAASAPLEPASKEQLQIFFSYLESALDIRGYFRPSEKKTKMIQDLCDLLTRPGFSSSELRCFHGVITTLDYFSPASPKGKGSSERKRNSKIHIKNLFQTEGSQLQDRAEND